MRAASRRIGTRDAVLCGALGGAVGAASMTVLRTAARRADLIEKTVPQVMEERLSRKLRMRPPGGFAGHHVFDQVLHVGYGLGLGAVYGLLFGRRQPATLRRGSTFGFATWVLGRFVIIPLAESARPAWKASLAENSVDLLSHLVFGNATALLTEELVRQPDHGPSSGLGRFRMRTG